MPWWSFVIIGVVVLAGWLLAWSLARIAALSDRDMKKP